MTYPDSLAARRPWAELGEAISVGETKAARLSEHPQNNNLFRMGVADQPRVSLEERSFVGKYSVGDVGGYLVDDGKSPLFTVFSSVVMGNLTRSGASLELTPPENFLHAPSPAEHTTCKAQ